MRPETIENYLKTIYNLSSNNTVLVSNKALSGKLNLQPATITEGLRKLHELKYVIYEKSYGSRLTGTGAKLALAIVRRHRLWETYLVKELGFGWDEVHEIAEELEHIKNDKLIHKLASLLGNPVYDPHGDPIPDKTGTLPTSERRPLLNSVEGCKCTVVGVNEDSAEFLNYLSELKIGLGDKLVVEKIFSFDGNLKVSFKSNRSVLLSSKVAEKILVTCSRAGCSCKKL